MLPSHRTTLKDIAQATGYSINTVSRALKDSPAISAAARKHIREVAEELGYVASASATAMRLGFSKTIAVIVGDIVNPHFAIMVREIENIARANQYSMVVLNTDEDADREAEAIELALSKGVDGILLCPVQKNKDGLRRIAAARVPFVLIDRYFDDMDTNAVVCNDVQGGQIATEYLLSQGHRKICFLNGPDYISSARERREGYCRAMRQAGLKVSPDMIKTVSLQHDQRQKQLHSILSHMDATAIFAFSDMIAWETIRILQECGLRVPDDMSVIGFDNLLSQFSFPFPLTSVCTYKTMMSMEAMQMLLGQLGRPYDPERPVSRQVISVSLAVRASTKPLEEGERPAVALASETVANACAYIRENFRRKELSLSRIARHVSLSANHLCTLFKKETGASFLEYLTRLRMEEAMEYLRNTALPSAEIAERVGYTDPAYFRALFKKHTGQSPRAYREANNSVSHTKS